MCVNHWFKRSYFFREFYDFENGPVIIFSFASKYMESILVIKKLQHSKPSCCWWAQLFDRPNIYSLFSNRILVTQNNILSPVDYICIQPASSYTTSSLRNLDLIEIYLEYWRKWDNYLHIRKNLATAYGAILMVGLICGSRLYIIYIMDLISSQ